VRGKRGKKSREGGEGEVILTTGFGEEDGRFGKKEEEKGSASATPSFLLFGGRKGREKKVWGEEKGGLCVTIIILAKGERTTGKDDGKKKTSFIPSPNSRS